MEILEYLVKEAVEEFNSRRSQRSAPDLFAADLAEKTLVAVDFSGVNLEKADLTSSNLTDANLMRARLDGIDGSEMNFTRAIGLRIKMRDAWLEEACLDDADFSRGDLNSTVMNRSRGEQIRMVSARLKDVEATAVQWPGVDFTEATLTRANFTEANLRRADLTAASANGATFTKAILDGAIAREVRLAGANLEGASLMGAQLEAANLSEANLKNAHLAGANLTGANLNSADLTGANLQGSVLADACLDGAILTDVDLTDVDLTGLDPHILGLTEEQIGLLSSFGAGLAASAPVMVRRATAAANGDKVAVLWENAEDEDDEDEEEEESSSIRWALLRGGKTIKDGVLPLAASATLAHCVVAINNGFELEIVQKRPGGISLIRYPLSGDGQCGPAESNPLGYAPLVPPIVEGGESLTMWGLARRGPTLAIHQQTEEGVRTVFSQRFPTARGFLGRHHPVLACKGGVLIPIKGNSVKKPLRTPEGFPGMAATVAPLEDRWMVVWLEKPRGSEKGGLRTAVLAERGAPETEVLTTVASVTALDALSIGSEVHLVWLEATNPLDVHLKYVCLPDLDPKEIAIKDDIHEIRLVPGTKGPYIAITTLELELSIVDLKGKQVGRISN
ncbi:MAG: pentapeptide repeat-containing protein [Proteobacteria bacterium]|jgi:uncharacterized protein YjbI with pentapeptide repeats|nr:pentapeptide repeat-containing protein [Pseudomonadota bacterium]